MRVLFLTSWYPTPDLPYGGVFVREHARAARAAGAEVTILHIPDGAYRGGPLWRLEHETDEAVTAGFPTYRLTSRSIRVPGSRRLSYWATYGIRLWSAAVAIRSLRRRGFRPDVIHAHVFNAAAVGATMGRLFGLPLVATEHSTLFPRRELDRGMLKRARYAFARADRVMPVSNSLKEAIEAYGIRARFEVVPNALDVALFHTDPAAGAGPGAFMREGPRKLLFVGRLEPTEHKGFPTLVAALSLLRERRSDWCLDVVGDGPSQDAYRGLVADAGLAGVVTFHGGLPKTTVARMMRSSDVFVLPSKFETQGVVLLESMASGLPIVSTTAGAIPEVVGPRDGILVEPGDPAALADALDRVLRGEASFDREDTAERARSRYSLEAVGGQLMAIYADVLAARGKPAMKPESQMP
jgi:glycosyltransferase involved in cell wall biosynthesis